MRCEIFLKVSFLSIHIQVLKTICWNGLLSSAQLLLRLCQFCSSVAQSCPTLWSHGLKASLSFTIFQSLLKLMSFESVMPSNHLILCHPLFPLPSIFLSITVFSNESAFLSRWSKYWGFSFSISPSNEYSGLISFRIDSLCYWTICLSLGQHHSVLITIGLYLVLKLLILILPTLFFYFKVFLVFPAF